MHLHVVLRVAGVRDVARVGFPLGREVGLAQQVERAGARHVELLVVDARADEDVVGSRVVGEREDGRLDACEGGAAVLGGDVDGALRAALEGVGGLALALGEGCRWMGRGGLFTCDGGGAEQRIEEGDRKGACVTEHRGGFPLVVFL